MKKTLLWGLITSFLLCSCGGGSVDSSKQEYTITYHLNDGINGDNPLNYEESMGTVKLKNPTKTSCTFKGWYTDPEYKNKITQLDSSINKNTDLYSKWAEGIVEKEYSYNLGIGKRYVIYQISDTHINAGTSLEDLAKEKLRLNESRISYARQFNEEYDEKYVFKESKQGLIELINYANNENPDVVCYSGDIMDFYSKENYDFVKNEVEKTTAPFVFALGNHETPASNFDKMPGVDTIEFTVLEFDDFEIVCLDNSQGSYTYNQINLLTEETKKNKPIIIVQHMPIVNDYNSDSLLVSKCNPYYYIDENSSTINKRMSDLICNNANIKLVLCGHIHGACETEIAEGKYQITCSSGLMGNICKITIR